MKKLEGAKTFQLVVFATLSLLCFYLIAIKSNVYHLIAESRELQLVCALLWITLFASFIFVFLDFSLYAKQKSDYNALDYAVHSDTLAKIANRQGIDEVIEKYLDKPLPDNVGCAMFLLTSLNEINRKSRTAGNAQIRNFSIILKLASTDICFVGRNGGNVFLAIFENTNEIKVDTFMERVEEKVREYNSDKKALPMYYQYGLAFREEPPVETINGLISLSSKRAHKAETTPNNISYIDEKRTRAKIASSKKTEPVEAVDVEIKPLDNSGNNTEPEKEKVVESNSEYGLPGFIIVLSDYKKEHAKPEEPIFSVTEEEDYEEDADAIIVEYVTIEDVSELSDGEEYEEVIEYIYVDEEEKDNVEKDIKATEATERKEKDKIKNKKTRQKGHSNKKADEINYKYSYEEIFAKEEITNEYYDEDKIYTEAI